jgi:hypothetical protein
MVHHTFPAPIYTSIQPKSPTKYFVRPHLLRHFRLLTLTARPIVFSTPINSSSNKHIATTTPPNPIVPKSQGSAAAPATSSNPISYMISIIEPKIRVTTCAIQLVSSLLSTTLSTFATQTVQSDIKVITNFIATLMANSANSLLENEVESTYSSESGQTNQSSALFSQFTPSNSDLDSLNTPNGPNEHSLSNDNNNQTINYNNRMLPSTTAKVGTRLNPISTTRLALSTSNIALTHFLRHSINVRERQLRFAFKPSRLNANTAVRLWGTLPIPHDFCGLCDNTGLVPTRYIIARTKSRLVHLKRQLKAQSTQIEYGMAPNRNNEMQHQVDFLSGDSGDVNMNIPDENTFNIFDLELLCPDKVVLVSLYSPTHYTQRPIRELLTSLEQLTDNLEKIEMETGNMYLKSVAIASRGYSRSNPDYAVENNIYNDMMETLLVDNLYKQVQGHLGENELKMIQNRVYNHLNVLGLEKYDEPY